MATDYSPAVVLLDLILPELDGWALARLLRSDPRTRDAVVIAVTAVAGSEDQDRALLAGCNEILTKPVPPTDLLAAVRRYIGRAPTSVDAAPRKSAPAPRRADRTFAPSRPAITAFIFAMTRARCTLIVFSRVPSATAICLFNRPVTTQQNTSRSRCVSVATRSTRTRCAACSTRPLRTMVAARSSDANNASSSQGFSRKSMAPSRSARTELAIRRVPRGRPWECEALGRAWMPEARGRPFPAIANRRGAPRAAMCRARRETPRHTQTSQRGSRRDGSCERGNGGWRCHRRRGRSATPRCDR